MYQLELLSLVFFEYSNYHRTYFEYSNCIYNIKLPVRVYCPNRPSTKIWNEDTLNILNPIEASLNIPSAYMSLSCFSDFIKQNWSVGIFSLRILWGYLEYSNHHCGKLEYSNWIFNIKLWARVHSSWGYLEYSNYHWC